MGLSSLRRHHRLRMAQPAQAEQAAEAQADTEQAAEQPAAKPEPRRNPANDKRKR